MPFVFKEPETAQQFWAHNAVKGKKGFQPTGGGDDGAALAGATGRWLQPGEDYPIKQAAEANMRGALPDTQAGTDAGVLLAALHAAPTTGETLYRGLQLPEIPKKGDIIREPLGAWTSTAASAEGYAANPAGAAVFGKAVPGKEVVLEVRGAKAVVLPMEEFITGGIFTVTGRRTEDGMTYVALQQNRTYEPPQGFTEPQVFTEVGDPEWRIVQGVAEGQEMVLAKAIEATFAAVSAGIDEEKMAFELAAHGNTGEIDWAELSKQLSDALETSIRTVATQTALALLPRFRDEHSEKFADPYETMSLVLRHSAAEDYLRKHLPTLVTNITRETQEAIRDTILDGFQNGVPPRDMARQIRSMIGLTRPQAATHQRLFSQLVMQRNRAGGGSLIRRPGSGVGTLNYISKQLARYDAKAIRYRAFNIARTETLRASNAGQQALWTAATNEGLLERGVTKREWIATPSERTCPYCMKLDGIKVGMEEAWHSELGDVTTPPLHPSCRCAMGIAIDPEARPKPEKVREGLSAEEQLTRLKILEDPDFIASRQALAQAKADWKAAPNDSDEKRAANKRINLAAIAMEDATNAARARIAREVEATNPEEAKALVRLLREEVTTLRAEYMRSSSKAMLESDLSIRRDTARDLLERLSAKLPLAERIEPRPVLDTKDPRWRLNPQNLAIEQRVYDNFLKISQAIEAEFGVRSRWSGAAHLGTLEPGAAAVFTWENAVSITAKTAAMAERDYLKVLMHEAFHGAQPLRPMEYMGKRGWEEGVVEMATQTFEASIRRRAGLPTGAGYNTYAQYTNALESIRGSLAMAKADFYGQLIRVPAPQREALVLSWIEGEEYMMGQRAKRILKEANQVLND